MLDEYSSLHHSKHVRTVRDADSASLCGGERKGNAEVANNDNDMRQAQPGEAQEEYCTWQPYQVVLVSCFHRMNCFAKRTPNQSIIFAQPELPNLFTLYLHTNPFTPYLHTKPNFPELAQSNPP
jgi:hypothetical protein